MQNISGWSLYDGFRLARTVGRNLKDPTNYSDDEFITAAEKAIKKHPREWVVYFMLGDKYQNVGRFADSLSTLKQCMELKPSDIRSCYALATAYNLFTRASWSPEEANLADKLFGLSGTKQIDLALIETEMKKAGLTIQASALQATRWFKKSLEMKPDNRSKIQILDDLNTLYSRFPFIKLQERE